MSSFLLIIGIFIVKSWLFWVKLQGIYYTSQIWGCPFSCIKFCFIKISETLGWCFLGSELFPFLTWTVGNTGTSLRALGTHTSCFCTFPLDLTQSPLALSRNLSCLPKNSLFSQIPALHWWLPSTHSEQKAVLLISGPSVSIQSHFCPLDPRGKSPPALCCLSPPGSPVHCLLERSFKNEHRIIPANNALVIAPRLEVKVQLSSCGVAHLWIALARLLGLSLSA